MRRRAEGDGREAGAGQFGDGAVGAARRDQRERARPEAIGQRAGVRVQMRVPLRVVQAEHMGDQRIETRAALGLEDARHSDGVRGVGAEAVDGLGRERDETARAQDLGGAGDAHDARCGFDAHDDVDRRAR